MRDRATANWKKAPGRAEISGFVDVAQKMSSVELEKNWGFRSDTTYPVYTVVSEKLHAITLLGMTNSRLKDYLDLWVLLERETLNVHTLAHAITATFTRRRMEIPTRLPIGLTDEFATEPSR